MDIKLTDKQKMLHDIYNTPPMRPGQTQPMPRPPQKQAVANTNQIFAYIGETVSNGGSGDVDISHLIPKEPKGMRDVIIDLLRHNGVTVSFKDDFVMAHV